jgi:hypothetical protein
VIGVLSAGLSSRPGWRLRNVILSLLAMRTVGELLHGYVDDDSDFWDPEEEEEMTSNEESPSGDGL